MTFREYTGYLESKRRATLETYDVATWQVMHLLSPHLSKGKNINFFELHPLRDSNEGKKQDEFNSSEELLDFLDSLNTNKDG